MIKFFEVLMLVIVIISVLFVLKGTDKEKRWCMMLYGTSGLLFIIGWVADHFITRL